jgi:phospholipid/cholesterol/gamma-HCH transport system substrate-binding protein
MVETLIGAVVIAVAGLFVAYAYNTAEVGAVDGYVVHAEFNRVDGLEVGSDVRMSGIKVGTVLSQKLDPTTYMAHVTMSIDPSIELPDDSSIKISMEGLLGGNYLSLEPGGSDKLLASDGVIRYTQGSVDLIGLVSQAIFSAGEADE